MDVAAVMALSPVIPVLVIDDLAHARPIAEALVAGGLVALEVTLRSPCALDAIRAMSEVAGAVVGAGTILDERDLDSALDAGARFIVSPGLTESLGRAAIDRDVAFLPGTATAGDVMRGLDMGLTHFKFFPAMAAGGVPALKALCAPLSKARFCPTGGITLDTAVDWLAIPQVVCVGGSWIVRRGTPDPARISALARTACTLARA
ncbi:bifunctional 4-hydroxy-2-oxoglutarate aldolase/2-dehydro-3-deoxy-phosphogluconate aldolase [uncultured Sphingomonas sp.]|uniref:bifunctional 4-hydroxy-2-oxoglutarate aldolase/2-dehydro-3-deoxy-phosphogluconate aldolase n=1 Tax=uncultured Sphingomonas sp. TaxID=158754 RepID=UPI0035CC99AF